MVDIIINVRRNTNMRTLQGIIDNVPEVLRERILQIFYEEGEIIQHTAKGDAPVKTGELQDLILMRKTSSGIEIIGAAEHTGYQELGTRYIKAKYFMTNAFKLREPILQQRIQQAIVDYFWEVSGR